MGSVVFKILPPRNLLAHTDTNTKYFTQSLKKGVQRAMEEINVNNLLYCYTAATVVFFNDVTAGPYNN